MIYYIVSGLIIALLVSYIAYLKYNQVAIKRINREAIAENQKIEEQIRINTGILDNVKINVLAQKDMVQALTVTAKRLRESAEQQAKESADLTFAQRMEELNKTYQEQENSAIEKLMALNEKVVTEQDKLSQLEAKQLAYIQAQQRQEALAANTEYYCLALDEFSLNDIKLLRELQKHFIKKEAIDKLIWESYYKSAYDILMSHLFAAGSGKVCGIYKITDLTTGLAYIGQSVDIRERWRQHLKASLTYGPVTNKLYQAMQKSGQSNFTFEILEEVPKAQLNEREKYWIEFYKTKELGMNGTRGNNS